MKPARRPDYNRTMPGTFAKAALLTVRSSPPPARMRRPALVARAVRAPAPPPAAPLDKRDSVVAAPGAFNRPSPIGSRWRNAAAPISSSTCLYTDIAAHAPAVKPDPKTTPRIHQEAHRCDQDRTVFFDGAGRFLMTDRGIERVDAVLIYDAQSRAAGDGQDRRRRISRGAIACPALYAERAQQAYSKACSEDVFRHRVEAA